MPATMTRHAKFAQTHRGVGLHPAQARLEHVARTPHAVGAGRPLDEVGDPRREDRDLGARGASARFYRQIEIARVFRTQVRVAGGAGTGGPEEIVKRRGTKRRPDAGAKRDPSRGSRLTGKGARGTGPQGGVRREPLDGVPAQRERAAPSSAGLLNEDRGRRPST